MYTVALPIPHNPLDNTASPRPAAGTPGGVAVDDPRILRLTTAIARRDPDAFERFYDEWFDHAYECARRFLRADESACLDLVQDAMIRASRRMTPLRSRPQLAAWLTAVVRTAAIDHIRREARRRARERRRSAPHLSASSSATPAAAALSAEELDWLRAAVADLAHEDRSLLLARFSSDATLAHIGANLGITADAAHGRIRRLLNRLHQSAKGLHHDTR